MNSIQTARSISHRRWLSITIMLVALLGIAIGINFLGWNRAPHVAPDDSNGSVNINTQSRPSPINLQGYVGPDACSACHAERVAEFRKTRHFQACLLPQEDRMPLGFTDGRNSFDPPDSPVRFRMEKSGSDFIQTATRRTPAGEQKVTSTIGMVYGSGAESDEVYFSWQGNHLNELPMSWLHTTGEWGTSGFDRTGRGDFSRPTTPRCMECHNTWMEHVPGTSNEYSRNNIILGVTCEVCHGPGNDHLTYHTAHPDSRTAEAIVHPGHLERERLLDLCAYCHSNSLKHRGPAFEYRPGKPLDSFYKTLKTKYPEDDHVANQTSYLRDSKCFQQAETLTCVTCHNPHQATRLNERGAGESACRKCHQIKDCHERESLPDPVKDNCIGCHMPLGTKIQVNFTTAKVPWYSPVPRWEHRIGVYPIARDEILLAWYQTQTDDASRIQAEHLTNSLATYRLDEAESYRQTFRYLAAINAYRQYLRLKPDPSIDLRLKEVEAIHSGLESNRPQIRHLIDEGKFDDAFELSKNVLEIKPDDAKTIGQLGTLYAIKGKNDLAIEYWKGVETHDPDDPYGQSMIGWQAYLEGRNQDALDAFSRAEEIEPYSEKINYHTALTLEKLGKWPEAIARFRKVLVINPNHLDANLKLNAALRREGKPADALPLAIHTVKITQERNLEALSALAETQAELGKFAEATIASQKMLELAQNRHPELIPEIRKRIEKWRSLSAIEKR